MIKKLYDGKTRDIVVFVINFGKLFDDCKILNWRLACIMCDGYRIGLFVSLIFSLFFLYFF